MLEKNASTLLPWMAEQMLQGGETVDTRGGRTKELLFQSITLTHPHYREVLTPGRGAALPAQIAETMWVLSGRNDVEWLARYLPRAPEFSDDGKVWRGGYGPRLRFWGGEVDQLQAVVEELKANPDSRRAVMQIFDPAQDYTDSKDIPCNNWLSFIIRGGALHLHVGVRSNDLIWGWSGINAFEWSALLEIVAGLVGVKVGRLHFSTTSLHVYERHFPKLKKLASIAGTRDVVERVDGEWFALPGGDVSSLTPLFHDWMIVEELIRRGLPKAEQALNEFPEPMLRGWLGVIWAYWNGGDTSHIPSGGRLEAGYRATPAKLRTAQEPEVPDFPSGSFEKFLDSLHRAKSAAYGGSWCRRGELLGIMANLARKVDRIGVAGGGDTAADTAVDFLVYLMLYRLWLVDELGSPTPAEGLALPAAAQENVGDNVARLLAALEKPAEVPEEDVLVTGYNRLEVNALSKIPGRWGAVDELLPAAYGYARRLWRKEQLEAKQWGGYGDDDE